MRTLFLPLSLAHLGCADKPIDLLVESQALDDSAPDDSDDAPGDSRDSREDPDETGHTGDSAAPTPTGPLEITYLGVGGVGLRVGEDLILTAPLLTNPDMLTVQFGETASDPDRVEELLPLEEVEGAAAILVGHAHYDHLLDVPKVAEMAGDPEIYANSSAANLLAATNIVTYVDDPSSPLVDRRMCATPDPCTGLAAGVPGDWIAVPGTNVRVRPLCSMHPDQFLGIGHFAEGCVDTPQAEPPASMTEWLEGGTLSWLIDFLDADGQIAYRVYYQDAPTDAPTGNVHPELLAEHPVDVALLCVGSFDYVHRHPEQSLYNLDPRYVVGIHWEDFFTTQDQPIEPIPFQPDPAEFDERALALVETDDELPVWVEGVEEEGRYWRPNPQTHLVFSMDEEGPLPVASAPAFEVETSTETLDGTLVLRSNLPVWAEDCLVLEGADCDDVDADGLTDAWEDLALERLRPTLRFDEAEPFIVDDDVLFDVGRVSPTDDGGVRLFILQGYTEDYGRCAVSFHDGDPERVAIDLELRAGEGAGDATVVGLYTAAHEGTATDHSTLLTGEDLASATFVTDEATGDPRWRVYASDGKHATYPTVDLCEDAEWLVCVEEDCDTDGVDEPTDYDRLPPFINAGEEDAPRFSGLEAIGFPDEDAWLDQDFCGGVGRGWNCSASVREKLLDDPFDG